MYYFAYGSNMAKDDLDKWCKQNGYSIIEFKKVTPAKLKGYKIAFNYFSSGRKGGAANIIKSDNDEVYGLLIELENESREIIRVKEGYCNRCYDEISVEVETLDGKTIENVLTYKVFKEKESKQFEPPTKYYLGLIISSAEKYHFPEKHLRFLKSIEVKA